MKSKEFPEIETNRLFLRKLQESDWNSILYLRSDKVVNQYIKRDLADTKEKALDFIYQTQLKIKNNQLFYWCISLKDDPEMIGSICLWNFSKDKNTAEMGYDLKPEFQKKGIMSESIQDVLYFGFTELKLLKIEAFTHKNNENSKRLLQKNMFYLREDRTDEENLENLIFEINRPADNYIDHSHFD